MTVPRGRETRSATTDVTNVPLTSGIVAQVFGPRYLATLVGVVFLMHQVGSFLGAWLGGRMYDSFGSYDLVWYVSIALGVLAGLINLPVDELSKRSVELNAFKDRQTVIVCRTDKRSARAAAILSRPRRRDAQPRVGDRAGAPRASRALARAARGVPRDRRRVECGA